jgi:hypothetical protein
MSARHGTLGMLSAPFRVTPGDRMSLTVEIPQEDGPPVVLVMSQSVADALALDLMHAAKETRQRSKLRMAKPAGSA